MVNFPREAVYNGFHIIDEMRIGAIRYILLQSIGNQYLVYVIRSDYSSNYPSTLVHQCLDENIQYPRQLAHILFPNYDLDDTCSFREANPEYFV